MIRPLDEEEEKEEEGKKRERKKRITGTGHTLVYPLLPLHPSSKPVHTLL
jgi:hypothetical protein